MLEFGPQARCRLDTKLASQSHAATSESSITTSEPPGKLTSRLLELLDHRRETGAVAEPDVQRASPVRRLSAAARALATASASGRKGSTVCATTVVRPSSFWSTRPFTVTIESTARLSSHFSSADAEDDDLDLALEVVERREHHVGARSGADLARLGDDAADRDGLLVGPFAAQPRAGSRPPSTAPRGPP